MFGFELTRPNHAERRVYHPQLVAVYHQCEALYIIKPQGHARWGGMRYSPKGLMICTARCAAMIYQACGLDKKIPRTKFSVFFGWGTGIRTPVMTESESVALPLGDAPIFSTLCIIAEFFSVVNTYFQLFSKIYSLFRKKVLFCFTMLVFCGTIHITS